ncbi:MAG: sensor histidine kinase [Planctomycetota bacterium]|jgi:two-component system sensor histidine kinase HydH
MTEFLTHSSLRARRDAARSGYRRARLAVSVVAAVIATVLLGSTLSSYFGAHALRDTVDRGQAAMHLAAFHRLAPPGPPPPSDEMVEDVLRDQSPLGLRSLSMLGPQGQVRRSFGSPSLAANATQDGITRTQDRVRFIAPGAPPRPGRASADGPPKFDRERPPHVRPAPPPQTPRIAIEFEPTMSAALSARATRDLWIGILGTLVLIAGALGVDRVTRRLERAESSLADQRHLASMGEMSAVMAHEIRNPLAALKGHAQLLAESNASEGAREQIDYIVTASLRLESLTTDLLDFARASSVVRGEHDPVEVAREASSHLAPGLVEYQLEHAPRRWSIDPTALRRMLSNLIDNAVEASPTGSPVRVDVYTRGGELVVEIADRGPGLPQEVERLFEPFVTRRTRGTGLGLAIVRRLAELHGGRAEALDRDGGGAVFRVFIPAS